MLADPELGPMFLQPLKSQGAVDTDPSGFITSVKFTSRPGEQFILRRETFARIQKAFQEHGIEFAEPRVTGDSEDDAARQAGAAAGIAMDRKQGEGAPEHRNEVRDPAFSTKFEWKSKRQKTRHQCAYRMTAS